MDPDADPDFLALSARQRKAIDRAFEKGSRASESRKRKRRKLDEATAGGSGAAAEGGADDGGFIVDDEVGGGFMVEDDAAGGFMIDDKTGGGFLDEDEDMGGFMPDDEPSTLPSANSTRPASPTPARLPLHRIPALLVALQLPADDDVLQVFKASASGWDDEDEPGPSRKRGEEEQQGGYVGKKDFRAVCAALMGPDTQGGDEEDEDDDDEDAFELEDGSESELSAVSSGYSDAGVDGKGKGKAGYGTAGTQSRRARKNKVLEEEATVRLSTRQKEMVADIWKLLKPQAGDRPADRILGRNEVKGLVRNLGEMWTEDEVGVDRRSVWSLC